MKFYLLLVSTLIVFSACQKNPDAKDAANAEAVDPKNTKDDVQNAVEKKTIINCTAKEVMKSVSADGTISHLTHELVTKESRSSKLVVKNGDTLKFQATGEYYSEYYLTEDAGAKKLEGKTDYTYVRQSENEEKSLGPNEFEQKVKSESKRTGRNGYQFSNPDKTKTDTSAVTSDLVIKFFDDGATYRVISMTSNGKVLEDKNPQTTTYKTQGKITKSVTTYNTLPEGTESYEKNCTEENL